MLVSDSHGQTLPEQEAPARSDFGYFFPDAPEMSFDSNTLGHLLDLNADMVEPSDDAFANHSSLPPVFTYFGQFIDHDITGVSEEGGSLPAIESPDLSPQPRLAVLATLKNLRTGHFDLDSLYGPSVPSDNPALNKLNDHLRFPGDRAKMWIGTFAPVGNRVQFPLDDGGDLLRLGHLLDSSASSITLADLQALPDAQKANFLDSDDQPRRTRAIIGDGRNDENLFIAQLHLAFLRFHNRVVDAFPGDRSAGDEDTIYNWARDHVRRFYQWLVVHVYLPGICDPRVVAEIMQDGPVLFDAFLDGMGWTDPEPLPMPMEFSVAAFRFGHSMVRGAYDWNESFGRGPAPVFPNAIFENMFLFTGRSPNPFNGFAERLPQNWGADWDRLVHKISGFADRSTRKIDTHVAHALTTMENEGANPIRQNLLARNLRRGAMTNLPSAQAAIAGLADLGITVTALTETQLRSGATAGEVAAGDFHKQTPLWFYVLKEAEVLGAGQRLGPLGSHLVAGTLIGLMHKTPSSVLGASGSVNGKWHPVDGPRVSGQLVDSFPAFIRAALLSANPDAGV